MRAPVANNKPFVSRLITPRAAEPRVAAAAVPMVRRSMLGLLAGAGATLAGGASRGAASAAAASPSRAEQVLIDPGFPDKWPFRPDQFERYDESPDTNFYSAPRFVTHIDDAAIAALTEFYADVFPPSGTPDAALLDICSSWISHYPKGYTAGRVAGLGLNSEELARNKALTEFAVRDLNADPRLPYEDNSFDVVTNAVSVDYLTKPLAVFCEINRVLRPGGLAVMSFSNRCFPTKAIALWTATGDMDHIWTVGSYFHYAGGFEAPAAKDITKAGFFGARGDPLYVVYARKSAAA
jgi:SAM-dependent methyltransferase